MFMLFIIVDVVCMAIPGVKIPNVRKNKELKIT